MNKKEWFESWFDAEYYHILYKHRDDSDARIFIDNIIAHLKLPAFTKVIDVACGKGRHSLLLHQKGMEVTGTDLSENSISFAKQYEQKGLSFLVNDMRNTLPLQFEVIFNLFTSFGYFRSQEENLKVLLSFHNMLAEQGYIVIDFFNAPKVIVDLLPEETIQIDHLTFTISRYVDGSDIVKNITFTDEGISHQYEERVQLLYLHHFMELCEQAQLTITATFGNYHLHPYSELHSERLIMIIRKKDV
jgi:SAM-dependent methyltransferase